MPIETAATLSEQAPTERPERACAPAPSYEERLALSRRIDWRFLLPNPTLDNAASVGRCDKSLRSALELFSPTTEFHESATSLSQGREFDLVVLSSSRAADVEQVAPRITPGGSIYIEVRRRLTAPATWFRTPARVASHLRQLGFENVQSHWHWRRFTSATSFLPIHDGDSAAHYFFNHQATSFRGWCKTLVGRIALEFGFRDLLIGSYSIVGRKVVK